MDRPVDEVTQEQLIADFKAVMADAEALLAATASLGGEEVAKVRAQAEESLDRVKTRLTEEQDALMAKTQEAVEAADTFVHENPWAAVGVAAGLGLLIGLLSGRR